MFKKERNSYTESTLSSMNQPLDHVVESFFPDAGLIENARRDRLLLSTQLGWRQAEMNEFFGAVSLEHVQIGSDVLFGKSDLFLMRNMID